ncbi:BlaI/MecI/CopY family transcriptional regulator [bacterium]|nr:BlaI/MecI/CopY family transcriptional regulator [bacterium]
MARKPFSFTFDPNKRGLEKILGELETKVMEIAWAKGNTTVRQVYERLQEERDLAYTTVMTVMSRLAEKGLLQRIREGSAFVYRPTSSRDEFTRSTVKKILGELLRDFASPAIAQFVDSVDNEDPEAMDELARLVRAKRRKKDA